MEIVYVTRGGKCLSVGTGDVVWASNGVGADVGGIVRERGGADALVIAALSHKRVTRYDKLAG